MNQVPFVALFSHHISPSSAWDCSAWVRTYALFLEERLECFRILKYDIEAERLPRPAQGQDKVCYQNSNSALTNKKTNYQDIEDRKIC